jgi:glycosyltransferase involved in cell wall biosynthesis
MSTKPTLSLIVPVYDEQDNLRSLHEAIVAALVDYTFEVIYVNDGSRDKSPQVLEEIARLDSRAKVIHFVRNYGQTAALTAGIRSAQAELLVTLDADLQNDPSDIPKMMQHLDNADVVCGWRKDRQDSYISRTLPSKIANWFICRLSNVYLHDFGCTLRIYRKEFIKDIPLYGEMHRFIPIYVTWAGARLVEVPVAHHPRTNGESKYGLWRIPKVLLDLTTLKFLRDFFVTPIYFFGWLGIGFALMGLIIMTTSLVLWMNPEHPELAASLTTLGPLLFGLGLVEITLGIIAEVLIRMHFELQQKEPYRIKRSNLEDTP